MLRHQALDEHDFATVLPDHIRALGLVPPALLGGIEDWWRSGDPDLAGNAARLIAAIDDDAEDGSLGTVFLPDERKHARRIARAITLGLPPEDVFERNGWPMDRITLEHRGGMGQPYLLSGDETRSADSAASPAANFSIDSDDKPDAVRLAEPEPMIQQMVQLGDDDQASPPGPTLKPDERDAPPPLGAPEHRRLDPGEDSPVHEEFRRAIHRRESGSTGGPGYDAKNGSGDDAALGRYQMRREALQDVGLRDADGNWTGKYDVHSEKDFLSKPEAQEKAIADYMTTLEAYLANNGATAKIGQKIDGIKAPITVTESGLIAAAHRIGHGTVKDYLAHLEKGGWKSDADDFPSRLRSQFLAVETRLREFQDVPYRR